jgi:hypothetical protein
MLYNIPLRVPFGRVVTLSQEFKDAARVAWYKENGITTTEHAGLDLVCGDSVQTYGTPFVCPFPNATLVVREFDTAIGGKGSRVQIRHVDWKGRELILGANHLSEISENQGFIEGDTIGLVGNNGSVTPKPSIVNPYGGSHLHLTLRVNGVLTDPLTFFDLRNPYHGSDTGQEKDMPPAHWAVKELIRLIEGMTGKPIEELVNNEKLV